jgi:hypothetical protein
MGCGDHFRNEVMVIVELLAHADSATISEGTGKLTVDGIFDSLVADQLPAAMPKHSVALRIRGFPSDAGHPNAYSLQLRDPSGKAVYTAHNTLEAVSIPEGTSYTWQHVFNHENLVLEMEGDYILQVSLKDGSIAASVPLRVMIRRPPSSLPASDPNTARKQRPSPRRRSVIIECSRGMLAGKEFSFCFERETSARPLYRYMHHDHARNLVELGEIQLTTVEACRRHEHGNPRKDIEEGIRSRIGLTPSHAVTIDQLPPFFHEFVRGSGTITNSIFEQVQTARDAYLLCFSRVFTESLFQRFRVDACVRIDDPESFIQTLTEGLQAHIEEAVTLRSISYEPRSGRYDQVRTALHPVWVKPSRFAHEQEVRALWTSTGQPTPRLKVVVPGLTRYLSAARLMT